LSRSRTPYQFGLKNFIKKMKLWSSDFVFSAPWKQTTEAVWKKYPNDDMTNVAHIDVIERKITKDGILVTTRLFGSHFSFPYIITQLLGLPEMCYAIEHSEVDLTNQKMTMRTVNYTFGSVLMAREKLVYSPNKDNPNETHLKQGAKVQINGKLNGKFASYFEQMLVDGFDSTSKVGRRALQKVLNTITVENILNTVKLELEELSSNMDEAVTKFDVEYTNITEKVIELSKDLEAASDMLNSEIQSFSNKIHTEFIQLITSLNSELTEVVIKLNLPESEFNLSNIRLCDAVIQAGISGKTENS